MKKLFLILFFFCWMCVPLALGEGEPFKWVQLPDLSVYGMDVNASKPLILADDWECTQPTRVTDIRIWGSWRDDQVPTDPGNVEFILSIHSDIPAGPNGHSRPGDVLWYRRFAPSMFDWYVYESGINEGWYDPQQGLYIFPGDHVCFEYVFNISESEAFCQKGTATQPRVYWLDVQAEPMGTTSSQFGWKTSDRHWNDDAVWGLGAEPYGGFWNELRYPSQHPYYFQSIDLAFTIGGDLPCESVQGACCYGQLAPQCAVTDQITCEQQLMGTWQGPGTDCTDANGNGIADICEQPSEQLDFGDAFDSFLVLGYPTYLGNNGARHVIRGPWLGDASDSPDAEPDGQPTVNADGDDLDVTKPIPNDDEDGVNIPVLIQGVAVPVTFQVSSPDGLGGFVIGWIDFNGNKVWGDVAVEQVVAAGYPDGIYTIPVTAPVGSVVGSTSARFRISRDTATILLPTGLAQDGEVEDYLLLIEPVYEKWAQPPVLNPTSPYPHCFWGWDEISIYGGPSGGLWFPEWACPTQCHGDVDCDGDVDLVDANLLRAAMGGVYPNPPYDPRADFDRDGDVDTADLDILNAWFGMLPPPDCPTSPPLTYPIVADDWLCRDRRPITDIHWWGSYVDYADDVAPGNAPDLFHIGIWTDVPAGIDLPYSHPGKMVWEWIVPRAQLNERYVGCDFHPDYMLAPDSCFKYDFIIPEDQWFYQEGAETIYWISISAIYPNGIPTALPWGWKTRPHFFNDDAVRIYDPTAPVIGSPFISGVPIEDREGKTWDMAFVLTTYHHDCRLMLTAAEQVHYDAYVAAGKDPSCWCWRYQCRGDINNAIDVPAANWRMYTGDLGILALATNWKKGPATGANPCADINHLSDIPAAGWSIYTLDLGILASNWRKGGVGEPSGFGNVAECPGYLP